MSIKKPEHQEKPIAVQEAEVAPSIKLVIGDETTSSTEFTSESQNHSASTPSILNSELATIYDGSPDPANSPDLTNSPNLTTNSPGLTNSPDPILYIFSKVVGYLKYFWSLRAPLFLIAAIAVAPKSIFFWIATVLLKPICSLLYQRLPLEWQNKVLESIPRPIRDSKFLQELGEGADQCLPFILFWLYLACAPFAVLWIAGHWVRGFIPSKPVQLKDGFVFGQNRKRDVAHPENNFYYSKSFGLVIFAFFALGLPAFFSYFIYQNLGIDRALTQIEAVPTMLSVGSKIPPALRRPKFIGGYSRKAEQPAQVLSLNQTQPTRMRGLLANDSTFVTSYNGYWPWMSNLGLKPTSANVFFMHFYLVSLACALSVLFFRAWFFFPLNFLSDEHEIYLTSTGVRRSTLSNWFLNVVSINRWGIGGGPDKLDWKEVKSLQHLEEGFTRLSPLPETAFKKESLTYKLLNKLASLIDGLTNRVNSGNYLVFSTTDNEGDFGRNLKINLNDLNRDQRARLFYAVKNWAPHVVIKSKAEELLLGSRVLQDVRYTQLWFDLLTSKTKVKRQSTLNSGESLRDGSYTIEERLSAGGQATAYLARNASGKQIVLKEFILAIASAPGALIESAREFETEVSLLSQLNNPGIVKLEDFFTEDGRVYVVLEYVQGQTLRQKVQSEGPFGEAEVVRLSKSVCDVLEYLHNFDPPIVHRDITPENILVLPDGTIKLIDFSLAVKNDGRSTTDSCGKQAFTPPEQFREEICPQSDLYGLGATMYYMLTGLPPKPITPSSPKTKVPNISEQLNKIVERATQLDLSQRYESVKWMKLDLSQAPLNHSI